MAVRARSVLREMTEDLGTVGRLGAKPRLRAIEALRPGLQPLRLSKPRDGLLYVPPNYQSGRPMPLVVMFHGAGANALHGLAPFMPIADESGTILLAPESRAGSWDFLRGDYGPDVDFVDEALEYVFERCRVNPARLAVSGFSDGASYALSLGIMNGDLFSHVIAFSPGFAAPKRQLGVPKIYVSHGHDDHVLPVEVCSRKLVPALKRSGYDPFYREFSGGHTVPLPIAREAMQWFLTR